MDIKCLDVKWGSTPRNHLRPEVKRHQKLLSSFTTQDKITSQPDVLIDIRIPNEFMDGGKVNIGITAGVETNVVSPEFLAGMNKMSLNIVPSKFTADTFTKTTYDKMEDRANGQKEKVGEIKNEKPIKGGEFLIRKTSPADIFIPENWTEEQLMIADMCHDFIDTEILPHMDRIDSMEEGLMPSLVEKAGALGLLGMSVPEDLGGMGVDFKTSLLATEYLACGYSFSVAYGAHTGIGTLPLLYYGTEDQKKKIKEFTYLASIGYAGGGVYEEFFGKLKYGQVSSDKSIPSTGIIGLWTDSLGLDEWREKINDVIINKDSERFEEAMIIFEFVINKFLKVNEFDSLQLGGVKSSVTFNELLKSTGLKRAGGR